MFQAMAKKSIFVLLLCSLRCYASLVVTTQYPSHFRLQIKDPSRQLSVVRNKDTLKIESRNPQFTKEIQKEIKQKIFPTDYFQNEIVRDLEFNLNEKKTDFFSFYKDKTQHLIIDFWLNEESDSLSNSISALKKLPLKSKAQPIEITSFIRSVVIQNFSPLSMRSSSKTPWRKLFILKDRLYLDDPKEKHLQIIINFLHGKKWQEAYRGMSLYNEKYGEDSNSSYLLYLKAYALIEQAASKGTAEKEVVSFASNYLKQSYKKNNTFSFKQNIFSVLKGIYQAENKNSELRELARIFYIDAEKNLNSEASQEALKTLFISLSQESAYDKMIKLLESSEISSSFNQSLRLVFLSEAYLAQGEYQKVINLYEKHKNSFSDTPHYAYTYNTAEAYFNNHHYQKALNLYQEITYPEIQDQVSLRKAFIFSLNNQTEKAISLYHKLSNSEDFNISFESNLRLTLLLDESEDKLSSYFSYKPENKNLIKENLKYLLWQTRLRLFIKNKKYSQALSYGTSLPLNKVPKGISHSFKKDLSEILFLAMQDKFSSENYSELISLWENYKNFQDSEGIFPSQFLLLKSFLKLGQKDKGSDYLKKITASVSFAQEFWWLDRNYKTHPALVQALDQEYEVIESINRGKWKKSLKKIANLEKKVADHPKLSFYKGLISFYQQDYPQAEDKLEEALINHFPFLLKAEQKDLIQAYLTSLVEQKKNKKFLIAMEPFCLNGAKMRLLDRRFAEAMSYRYLKAAVNNENYSEKKQEKILLNFKENFKKSGYTSEVNYLLGLNYIKAGMEERGKDILEQLTRKEDVPEEIQGLARSKIISLTL